MLRMLRILVMATLTLVAIPAMLIAADPFLRTHVAGGEKQRWVTPDGSATIVVYYAFSLLEMFTVRFPGQGSDGPGIVRVFDPARRMLKQFALDWLGDAEPVYEGSHCATIQTLHTFCWPDRLQYHGSPG